MGALTSFKTEKDVLAYPPTLVFSPTLANYETCCSAPPPSCRLISSFVASVATTIATMLLAVPAAYALARLNLPGRRAGGFYILATQMLPPVG